MAIKLEKSTYPTKSSPDDFVCFGPPATKDGDFSTAMIADLGCFNQDLVDSNKFYFGCVCQHKKTNTYYAYFEWGRTGLGANSFQFIECSSKDEAQKEFAKQMHSKNDKRGEWVSIAGHNVLRAKAGKDCYLVRPAAKRNVGLPDAKNIVHDDSSKKTVEVKKASTTKSTKSFDKETIRLMRDMNVGTIDYARASIQGGHIPTQEAIDKVRDLLDEAQKRVGVLNNATVQDQCQDKELRELSSFVYGMIPKTKRIGAPEEEWILSSGNIQQWRFDTDAFESALHAIDIGEAKNDNPFEGMNIEMKYMPSDTLEGKFLSEWMPKATANKHSYIGKMNILNMWAFKQPVLHSKFSNELNNIKCNNKEKPLFQPKTREDLDSKENKLFKQANVNLLFHGTRSVNVPGILREGLRLPKNLVGVVITGAMFGPGVYWADDWKKSDGYTSRPGTYWTSGSGAVKGRKAFMFVSDVALGTPYLADGPKGYVNPPKGYDSVFGKAGHSRVQNNEWIVYNTAQNNLRYLVEYDVS